MDVQELIYIYMCVSYNVIILLTKNNYCKAVTVVALWQRFVEELQIHSLTET